MLKLIETVEREVECVYEGCYGRGYIDVPASQPYDGEPGTNPDYYKQKKCPKCGDTDHPGHRTVVYQVEAEDVQYDFMGGKYYTWLRIDDGGYFEGSNALRDEANLTLADKLLTAHLAGEDLPGVTVTEMGRPLKVGDTIDCKLRYMGKMKPRQDCDDDEDEYTRARHGERVEEPSDD